ncbi:MAG: acyl-CoA dehydrogenase family protein [Xanthobacteraceae bacterium]|nr:acyl-CoA dehydrogenase family protein [Xanthobacteraceae bacterium]PWB63157.1 MAG: acyl-CoA dehydrogenase [Bradyrhizobiaceae bacterium]
MEIPAHPALTPEHEAFRETVRRFTRREIMPHAAEWDEAGEFPRELYGKAAAAGLLGLGFPEAHGGTPADLFHHVILSEEIARAGAGGVHAGLFSHQIGAPPIAAVGSEELKARVLPGVLAGEKISALAITEPGGGSDVANLRTAARREGADFVVNGEKAFITSGMRADLYTVAVRTGREGAAGVSLLLIERDRPGFTRAPLKKMGWWSSDTALLHFADVRVPVANLIGEENAGFRAIMLNFNAERLGMAAAAVGFAEACLEEALAWAQERRTFGKRLAEHQAIRHKLVDMQTRLHAARALVYDTCWKLEQAPRHAPYIAQLAMAKNFAGRTMQLCADEAVQILGGAGFMRGTRAERVYREVKVFTIGGGAEEIMKDLAAKQLGW